MTTIQGLPEEVLSCIFTNLNAAELKQAQKVCWSWYYPAHTASLSEIIIKEPYQVASFITSIDSNPNTGYLNAVKTIHFDNNFFHTPSRYLLTENIIEKLFSRFPNLLHVSLADSWISYEDFTDQVCQTMLSACTRLDTFEISTTFDQHVYRGSYLKLRQLLTFIDLSKVNLTSRPESAAQFLTHFPRLKRIKSVPIHLDSFEKMLPAITHLTNLKSIHLIRGRDDQANFAQHFMETLTRDEREQLIETLSQVTDLEVHGPYGVNSTKFVTRYFTGLEKFVMISMGSEAWTDAQFELFHSQLLDMACNAKIDGRLYFEYMQCSEATIYISFITQRIFTPTYRDRVVELIVSDRYIGEEVLSLIIDSRPTQSLRKIDLTFSSELSLDNIVDNFFNRIAGPFFNANTFVLSFYSRDTYDVETTIDMIDEILDKMLTVTKVVLNIPASFAVVTPDFGMELPLIDTLNIRAITGVDTPAILDTCAIKFPRLNRLDIAYFCGTWNEELKEFQLDLSRYNLDRLTVDVTPAKRKMGKDVLGDDDFLVIEVEHDGHTGQLYRIGLDPFVTTSIMEDDLRGFADYLRIHITVGSLERLDIDLFYYGLSEETYMDFYSDVSHLRVFDNE